MIVSLHIIFDDDRTSLMVQKLLTFTFSIGNALKVPKIGVLGDFRGENCNIYL